MRFPRALCISALGLALTLGSPAAAQTYNVHFHTAEITSPAGSAVTLSIDLDNTPEAVTGFSFGVKHDAAFLTLEEVTLGPAVQAALGGAGSTPDSRFFQVNKTPAGGTGFTVGLLLSGESATRKSIAAGTGQTVVNARYRIQAGATGSSTVEIVGTLGQPAVPVVIDVAGSAKTPTGAPVTRATVTVGELPSSQFIRGDANQSGRLDVTDATIIVDFLFGGSALPGGAATRDACPILMNVDGSVNDGPDDTAEDEFDVDITDVLVLVRYFFRVTQVPPAAPFPQCGAAPGLVSPEFLCTAYAGCGPSVLAFISPARVRRRLLAALFVASPRRYLRYRLRRRASMSAKIARRTARIGVPPSIQGVAP